MANLKLKTTDGAVYRELRKEAGTYIRKLRGDADLSQSDLAKKLDLTFYSFISQVETGVTRIPPDAMGDWARALNVSTKQFAKTLLRYYDPFTYAALYDEPGWAKEVKRRQASPRH